MSNRIYGQTFVVYPDSFDMSAFDAMNSQNVPFAYALHDKDVEEDGTLKKAHIHVYVQGKLNKQQKEFLVSKGAPNYFEDVRSDCGMWAYLTHDNQPEKYRYSRDCIMMSRAFCPELIGSGSNSADYSVQIIGLLEQYHIIEYSTLVCLCLAEYPEYYNYVIGKGRGFIRDFIASVRWQARDARISDYRHYASPSGRIEDAEKRYNDNRNARLQGDIDNGDVDVDKEVFGNE